MDIPNALQAFQDGPALIQIRSALWSADRLRRAAVMIGAGISRNAAPMTSNPPPFPLWKHLIDAFADKLGIPVSQAQGRSLPQLGSRLESQFGRPALDELLFNTIPWQQYRPGRVHELLLSLPWADIFTTNYDDLLEQAALHNIDRHYDLILSAADLSSRAAPRIVKLHGSFPSTRPFVFTEEDFRRYPTDATAFVNMVQQSILENTFCLLGFSGDDPNFQAWAGWARDHLGPYAPTIYLCGFLDWSPTDKSYWAEKNVVGIDLSPLFPRHQFDETERYSLGIQWFLGSLAIGEQADLTRWPDDTLKPRPALDPRLPPLFPNSAVPRWSPDTVGNDTSGAQWLAWSHTLASHPGWVVLSNDQRSRLRWSLASFDPRTDNNEAEPTDFLLATQWVRAAELLVMPFSPETTLYFQRLLDRYDPFSISSNDGVVLRPHQGAPLWVEPIYTGKEQASPFDWQDARSRWIDLALAVLRTYRQQQVEGPFEVLAECIAQVVAHLPEYRSALAYEQCLFSLARMDFTSVRALVKAWKTTDQAPLWSLRKAAILIELDQQTEAAPLIDNALAAIRARLRGGTRDLALLSQEGCALSLSLLLGNANFLTEDLDFDERTRFRQRLDELSTQNANPFQLLEAELSRVERLASKSERQRSRDFDEFYPHTFNSETERLTRTCLELLTVLERLAWPLPLLFTDGIAVSKIVVKALWPTYPLLALSLLCRTNITHFSAEDLEDLMSVPQVLALSDTTVDELFKVYSNGLSDALHVMNRVVDNDPTSSSLTQGRFKFCAEILGRLTPRLGPERRQNVFQLACESYRSPAMIGWFGMRTIVSQLFRHCWQSASTRESLTLLSIALKLPMLGEAGLTTAEEVPDWWPETLAGFLIQPTSPIASIERLWAAEIGRHLMLLNHDSRVTRNLTARRLLKLSMFQLLSPDEEQQFYAQLFDQGLEHFILTTRYAADYLLAAPEGFRDQGLALLKGRWLLGFLPTMYDLNEGKPQFDVSRAALFQRACEIMISASASPHGGTGIHWSSAEALQLIEHCQHWWTEHEQHYIGRAADGFYPFDLAVAAKQLVTLHVKVMLPIVETVTPELEQWIEVLKAAAGTDSSAAAQLLPWEFSCGKYSLDEIDVWIGTALYSQNEKKLEQGLLALDWWEWWFDGKRPIGKMWNLVAQRIALRHPVGLALACSIMTTVLKMQPGSVSDSLISPLMMGLEFLLVETAYVAQGNGFVPERQRPEIAAAASELAVALIISGKCDAAYPVMAAWAERAKTDAHRAVRFPWEEMTVSS